MKRVGLWLAIAALAVNAPRLVLVYLRVDGLALPAGWEAGLLILTAIATGAVLSGGGAYIAHTLAKLNHGGKWRFALATIWVAMLSFSVFLIAPLLVVGIEATELAGVLNTDRLQWGWAVVAVAAVEILAAGAMIADALLSEPNDRTASERQTRTQPSALNVLTNAVAKRIEAGAERPSERQRRPAERVQSRSGVDTDERTAFDTTGIEPTPAQAERARAERTRTKEEAKRELIRFVAECPDASYSEIGDHIGRSKSTVGTYVDELEEAGWLHRNGQGFDVLDGVRT